MDEAIEWFKLTKLPRWVLSYGDASSNVFGSSTDGISHETAVAELQSWLRHFPKGKTFKLVASPSKDATDTKKHIVFTGSKSDQGQYGVAGPWMQPQLQQQLPAAGVSKEEIAQIVADAIAKERLESELKALREEVARLKGEAPQTATDAAMSTFLQTVNGYVPYIMFGNNPPPPVVPVSGPRIEKSEEEVTRGVAEAMQKIEAACKQMNIDLPDMLAKMAAVADRDPAKVAMLNSMLG